MATMAPAQLTSSTGGDDTKDVEYERIQETAERQLGSIHSLSVSLLKKLRSSESQANALLEENRILEAKNADLVAELARAAEKAKLLTEKEEQLARLAIQLNLAKKELISAKHDSRKTTAEKEALSAEKDALLAEKDTLQSQINTLSVQIDTLNTELSDANAEAAKEKSSFIAQVQERDVKIEEYIKDRDEIAKKRDEASTALVEKEAEYTKMQMEKDAEIKAVNANAEESLKKVEQLEEAAEAKQREMEEIGAEKFKLEQDLAKLNEEKTELEAANESLRKESDEVGTALGNAEKERDDLTKELQDRDAQLASLTANFASVEKDRDDLREVVEDRNTKISKLNEIFGTGAEGERTTPETVSRDIDAGAETAPTPSDDVDKLSLNINALKQDRDSLKDALAERASAVDDLTGQVTAVSTERDSLNERRAELETELNNSKEKIRKSEEEVAQLQKDLSMVETDRDSLAEAKLKLEKDLAHVRSRVQELEVEKASLEKRVEQLIETERMLGLALDEANKEKDSLVISHQKALRKLAEEKDREFERRNEELRKELDSVLRKDVDEVVDRFSVSTSGTYIGREAEEGDTLLGGYDLPAAEVVQARGVSVGAERKDEEGFRSPPLPRVEAGETVATAVKEHSPVLKPVPEPAPEPVLNPVPEPTLEAVLEPVPEPAAKPVLQPVPDEAYIGDDDAPIATHRVPSVKEVERQEPAVAVAEEEPRDEEVTTPEGSPVTPAPTRSGVGVAMTPEAPATAIFGEKESKDLESIVEDEGFRGTGSRGEGITAEKGRRGDGDVVVGQQLEGSTGVVQETLISEVVEDSRENETEAVQNGYDIVEEVDEEVMVPAEEAEHKRKAAADGTLGEEGKAVKDVKKIDEQTGSVGKTGAVGKGKKAAGSVGEKVEERVGSGRAAPGKAKKAETTGNGVRSGADNGKVTTRGVENDAKKSSSKLGGIFRSCCGAPEQAV